MVAIPWSSAGEGHELTQEPSLTTKISTPPSQVSLTPEPVAPLPGTSWFQLSA